MAADRSRLAAALAYKQAEEERRRRMLESIPTPAGTTPAQPAPQADFRTNLENLSIGVGEGLTNQLEGIKGMVTDPVGTAKGVYEVGKAVVRDPAIIASALRQMGQKAMSGPLGAGEVMGEMIGPRKTGPVMAELDVYHGTPHRFPATEANPLGEFDASKIGTGEGAQAYGHGIYYAENPGVAKSYQFVNAKIDPDTVTYSGKSMQSLYDAAMRKQTAAHRLKDEKSIQKANAELAFWEQMMVRNHPDQVIADVMADPEDWPEYTQFVKGLDRAKFKNVEQAGNLYKADLPDKMIDRMLDWDKPLSEQPAAVREAMQRLVAQEVGPEKASELMLRQSFTGQYAMLHLPAKNSAEESAVLRQAGIPGIKYLDAGSRGQGGSGTRNFVVFPGEEKKVRILERK